MLLLVMERTKGGNGSSFHMAQAVLWLEYARSEGTVQVAVFYLPF